MKKYKTTIWQTGNNTGIPVPPEVLEALGAGKRPAVKVTVNDYTYQSTVGSMDGNSLIPFSAAHRDASGLKGGDKVDVTLEVDAAPRTVTVPKDLAAALKKAGLQAAFDASAPSAKKEFVRQVESAKAEDTRLRRIEKIVTTLKAKKK
ncbi:MAG: YdeI/OmpD-associated family protein [Anaerolineales bacterium]|nr:DUF1905 domain-containing protein [Anaerolineales bacterium]MCL4258261.1 YdeI/OmpD-associated family protein [Anaerolineales bacterium]